MWKLKTFHMKHYIKLEWRMLVIKELFIRGIINYIEKKNFPYLEK